MKQNLFFIMAVSLIPFAAGAKVIPKPKPVMSNVQVKPAFRNIQPVQTKGCSAACAQEASEVLPEATIIAFNQVTGALAQAASEESAPALGATVPTKLLNKLGIMMNQSNGIYAQVTADGQHYRAPTTAATFLNAAVMAAAAGDKAWLDGVAEYGSQLRAGTVSEEQRTEVERECGAGAI